MMNIPQSLRVLNSLLFLLAFGTGSANAVSGNWTKDNSGFWSTPVNWSPATGQVGIAAGDTVSLNFGITANRTVMIDGTSRTAGVLNIGSANSSAFGYTITAGSGLTLTMNNNGNGALINKGGASRAPDDITVPLIFGR